MSLQNVPDEILQQIILYLPVIPVIQFQRTCRKARDLIGPVVWRRLCRTHFSYWSPHHKFDLKLSLPLGDVDWRLQFVDRFSLDREVDDNLEKILANQTERTQKIERIASLGWDAKDALLRHCHSANKNDILARRWYAQSVLDCLHRSIAIQRWTAVGDETSELIPLESALAGFDIFVSQNPNEAEDSISVVLDAMKSVFLEENESFSNMGLTEQATVIARFLRHNRWVGIESDPDARYHDIQNNFIGHALLQPPHSSLPLVSVAIYCALAQRLGVDAKPCGFPFHVLAVIDRHNQEAMFMDPFRSDGPVQRLTLISQLQSMGAPPADFQRLLQSASSSDLLARCARNIITSIQTRPHEEITTPNVPTREVALYASLWVLLITASNRQTWSDQHITYLDSVIRILQAQFTTDIWLMQKFLLPALEDFHPGVEHVLQQIRFGIDSPKDRKPRRSGLTDSVRFRVGQVFHHRRYHYHAIIIGWDVKCEASEQWIDQMGVHTLPKGRDQSFYHVLVEDKSIRYVAEENISITTQEPLIRLMEIAGRYFKRWDNVTKTFVSNIRDEYPDD